MSNYYNLLESILSMGIFLCEGIEDMKKYYPNINGDDFIKYIELDPTYKQGSDKAGQYAKWLLGLANKNDGKLDRENHITDILTRFDREKKLLKDKDIMKFKSVDDLDNYLNNDDNYNDLSHRLEVRLRQKDRHNSDLSKEAKLIYEDEDWEVWVPETYAASCKLGQGTRWCTASTETSEYFDAYYEDGELYININKHNPKEKYQFHFESGSYMDKDDKEIDIVEFFVDNPILYKKVYKDMYEFNIDDAMSQLSALKEDNYTYYYSGFEISDYIRNKIKKVVVLDNVFRIGEGEFSSCDSLTSVTIPNSVSSIGDSAFENCSSLTSIVIPDSVTSIGEKAFFWCKKLKSVTIGNSVTIIGSLAFYGCTKLLSIEIPDSVTNIGNRAFYNCRSLTSVTIPNKVTSIGESAFYDCWSLTSVVIPNSVTNIGRYAFSGCPKLTIYCRATAKPNGWDSEWTYPGCLVVWGYNKSNKTNESLQEVTSAERMCYGEKLYINGGLKINKYKNTNDF